MLYPSLGPFGSYLGRFLKLAAVILVLRILVPPRLLVDLFTKGLMSFSYCFISVNNFIDIVNTRTIEECKTQVQ